MMLTISYERQLREAFSAGHTAAMAQFLASRKGGEFFANTPKTYEEWIASIKDRPQIARG